MNWERIVCIAALYIIFAVIVFSVTTVFAQRHHDIVATPNGDGSWTLVIPKELVEACNKEGGCSYITQQALQELMIKYCGPRWRV